nr:hypothetical protein T04C9.4 - Caenorhabditis elegans [Caenorhabditis elegans]
MTKPLKSRPLSHLTDPAHTIFKVSSMPFKPVEHPKCPKCGKSVYAAEEMSAGGYKWHKFCFKCSMCNKLLDSMSCCEHQAQLFCKQCHCRRYGPKGIGFGIGAGSLTMDTGEQFGNTEVDMTLVNVSCFKTCLCVLITLIPPQIPCSMY